MYYVQPFQFHFPLFNDQSLSELWSSFRLSENPPAGSDVRVGNTLLTLFIPVDEMSHIC